MEMIRRKLQLEVNELENIIGEVMNLLKEIELRQNVGKTSGKK